MIELIKNIDFKDAEERLKRVHIGVIGDLMLDVYHHGQVSRISPEAPVPIVDVSSSDIKPGGAANVCRNLVSLGTGCTVFGTIGQDENGKKLESLFSNDNIRTHGLISVEDRPTTTKMRIFSHGQQLLRLDYEERTSIDSETEKRLIHVFKQEVKTFNAVIFQDYNKGLLTPNVIHSILKICHQHHIPVFVDPKFENYMEYKRAYLFKPNRKEASELLHMKIETADQACQAAVKIRDKIKVDHVLITLGEEGMVLLDNDNDHCLKIPTRARKIHDVTGAGDTVISTVTAFSASGYSLPASTVLANLAAGKVCEEVGIIPITLKALCEISQDLM